MKTIVFIQSVPLYRVYKIAFALKKLEKYRIVLVGERVDKKIFSGVADEIIEFHTSLDYLSAKKNQAGKFLNRLIRIWSDSASRPAAINKADSKLDNVLGIGKELIGWRNLRWKKFTTIIKNLEKTADIFYSVAEPNLIPEMVRKNTRKSVIYDTHDFSGIRYGIEELNPTEQEREKFCLENADAIITKFPEWILNYYRQKGYKIDCPFLNFIDYCLPEFFVHQERKIITGDIHLVYAGIAGSSSLPVLYHGNNQPIETIKKVIKQGIYFHLYVSRMKNKKLFADYYKLSDKNKYFIMHGSKPQPEIQKEMSQYHFGCILNDFSHTKQTKLFAETSFGNKFSTYLEANLPIIINEDLKLNAEYVDNYKVGFKMNLRDLPNLAQRIKEIDYQKLQNNIKIAREGPLNIYNNINKLADFYDEIISAKNN